jgi:hypothetical protein
LSIGVYYFFYTKTSPICDSLKTCFLFIFDSTFKGPAGYTGDFYATYEYLDEWKDHFRILYEQLYFFVIFVFISEIISAIVINEFKSLREENK